MVTFIKKLVRATVFEWRRKRAIKKAQKDADLLRRRFLVLVMDGKPTVVSMQGIKKLIRTHRFAKGLFRYVGTYQAFCVCRAVLATGSRVVCLLW